MWFIYLTTIALFVTMSLICYYWYGCIFTTCLSLFSVIPLIIGYCDSYDKMQLRNSTPYGYLIIMSTFITNIEKFPNKIFRILVFLITFLGIVMFVSGDSRKLYEYCLYTGGAAVIFATVILLNAPLKNVSEKLV